MEMHAHFFFSICFTEKNKKLMVLEYSSHRYRGQLCLPKETSHLGFVEFRCFSSTLCPLLALWRAGVLWLGRLDLIPQLFRFLLTCFLGESGVPTMVCPGQPPHRHRPTGSPPLTLVANYRLPEPFCELSQAHYSSAFSFQSNLFIKLLVNSSGTQSQLAQSSLFQWQH